jgi:hypothetical protein
LKRSLKELKKKLAAAEAVIQSYKQKYTEDETLDSATSSCPTQQDDTIENGADETILEQIWPITTVESNATSHTHINAGKSKQDLGANDINTINSEELMDINSKTENYEFHGGTSVIALFNGLSKEKEARMSFSIPSSSLQSCERQRSVVTDFHNDKFLGQLVGSSHLGDICREEIFALNASLFIDAYFKTFHFVHPILDQACFLKRCNDLWAGRTRALRRSFLALYFSVLCLGAAVRTWTEDSINGMDRMEWSRLLFEKAERALGRDGSVNDLEAIQAPFILSLVCQQQLDLNLAYAFLGKAIRTAFSTGINRKPEFVDRNYPQDSPSFIVGRTWWALYNLEIELSFVLGRPDTLGVDSYHNRPLPPIDNSGNSIVPVTYQLSYIIRKISPEIYFSRTRPDEKLYRATQIEVELEKWFTNLPEIIRPPLGSSADVLQRVNNIRRSFWPSIQMLILKISE